MFSTSGENNCIIKKTTLPSVQKEVVSEISLPDYLPDVSRLLRTNATVGNENNYVNDRSLEYDGEINYVIIYATSDGRIKSIPLSAEFDGVVSLPELTGDYQTQLRTDIESVTCRLQNPRRLTVKTKLCVSVDVYSDTCVSPQFSGKMSAEDEARVQKKIKNTETMCLIHAKDENVPISEDVELDSGDASIGEIVSVTLAPFISEVRASEDALSYRGDIIAEIVYLAASDNADSQAEYYSFTRKIPVSGDVDAKGVNGDFTASGCAVVSGVEFRPQTNALGENRVVEIDFSYTVHLYAVCNTAANVVTDMYSIDYQSVNELKELESRRALKASAFNFTADGSSPLDDKDYDKVVAASASAAVDKVEKNGSKASFNGKIDVSVILTNGAGSYIGRTFSIPLRAETEVGKSVGELECSADTSVLGTSVRIDGTDMKCDAEVGISFVACDVARENAVEKCVIMKDRPQNKMPASNIVICYPGEDDGLWDIAKRYGISEKALREANSLGGEISAGSVIIIPSENKKKPIF